MDKERSESKEGEKKEEASLLSILKHSTQHFIRKLMLKNIMNMEFTNSSSIIIYVIGIG